MKMVTETSFNDYLNNFVARYVKGLPESFDSVQHYRTTCMLLFNGWDLLKMFPEYSSPSPRFKQLEEVLKEFDQFDTTLGRPIEMKTIRSIMHNPTWREIRRKIRMLPF